MKCSQSWSIPKLVVANVLLVYVIMAIIKMDFNPAHWDTFYRGWFVLASFHMTFLMWCMTRKSDI